MSKTTHVQVHTSRHSVHFNCISDFPITSHTPATIFDSVEVCRRGVDTRSFLRSFSHQFPARSEVDESGPARRSPIPSRSEETLDAQLRCRYVRHERGPRALAQRYNARATATHSLFGLSSSGLLCRRTVRYLLRWTWTRYLVRMFMARDHVLAVGRSLVPGQSTHLVTRRVPFGFKRESRGGSVAADATP